MKEKILNSKINDICELYDIPDTFWVSIKKIEKQFIKESIKKIEKQFIKELKEFIKDKTMIKSSKEGTNISLVKFFPFEFEDFIKQKVGFKE